MLGISDCVEAHILELRAPENAKKISIVLRLIAGPTAVLRADGVDRFLANEFREQNIIDRITVWDMRSDKDELHHRLAELIGNDKEPADIFQSLIVSEAALILKGQKILVEIEPVYGVWILMLAENISLEVLAP